MPKKIQGSLEQVWVAYSRVIEDLVKGVFEAQRDAKAYSENEGWHFQQETVFVSKGRVWLLRECDPHQLQPEDLERVAKEQKLEKMRAAALSKLTREECAVLGYVKPASENKLETSSD